MFTVGYIDNKTDKICIKSGFKQISEAIKWGQQTDDVIPLYLYVYNDYIDSNMKIMDL
ncbi:MAG: hypothetical protein ACI4RM_07770 [Ruminococcus sp.]